MLTTDPAHLISLSSVEVSHFDILPSGEPWNKRRLIPADKGSQSPQEVESPPTFPVEVGSVVGPA